MQAPLQLFWVNSKIRIQKSTPNMHGASGSPQGSRLEGGRNWKSILGSLRPRPPEARPRRLSQVRQIHGSQDPLTGPSPRNGKLTYAAMGASETLSPHTPVFREGRCRLTQRWPRLGCFPQPMGPSGPPARASRKVILMLRCCP